MTAFTFQVETKVGRFMEESGEHVVDVKTFNLSATKKYISICRDRLWKVEIDINPCV